MNGRQHVWRRLGQRLCGVVAGVAASVPALAEAPAPVVLVTQVQVPYVEADREGVLSGGLALDRVRCVFRRMRLPLEIRVVAWARGQAMVEYGQAAGFFPASRNAQRDAWATVSDPVAPQEWRWYLLADNPIDPTTEAFRRTASVTAYHGSNMATWLQNNSYRMLADPASHDELLPLLLRRRVDAVLGSHLAMAEQIRKRGAQSSVRSVLQQNRPLGVYFGHRFLARAPQDFLARFNSHLAACKRGAP